MIRNQSGQVFILAIIVLFLVLINTILIISNSLIFFQNSRYSLQSIQASGLAEAGIDKAIASLNKTGGEYSGDSEINLGVGSFSTKVVSKDAAVSVIESTGYIPNKESPKVKKTVRMETSRGVGVSFVYGIQIGEGGVVLGNNNKVLGSMYSNGNVSMGNNNLFTGDIYVAGGPQGSPNQQTDCTSPNCFDYFFGKNISGENRLDVAMSFKPGVTAILNKISLKVKKVGSPPNSTVRILSDDDGEPDKNDVITSGTLYSNLVSTSYGWIDVTFNSSPTMNAETTYWIMVDTSSNTSNYWSWQNDLAQSYTRGIAKWSSDWSAGNPSWNSINGDLSFAVTMGGVATFVQGGNGDIVQGEVHANTIQNLTIQKDAYYQSITGSTVNGASCDSNPSCHPGSEDPPPKVFPISDANVVDWKSEASLNALGNPVCDAIWGPGKYTGSITLDNSCIITVKTPIWITGSVTLGNSNTFKLDSSYGSTSGVLVVGGQVVLGNGNKLEGTGAGSSLLMLLTEFDSRPGSPNAGENAVTVGNVGNTGVFYASKGIIDPGNDNKFKELTAWKILLTNNTEINYETGLSSTLFTAGPSGSYTLIKGTYRSN